MPRQFAAPPDSPEITFLGHAGCLVRYRQTALLCDPWLSEEGAFLHSWHQYPPNDFLDREALYRADYLYISHDHADHFDRPFLAGFPKDRVTVLVADFLSDYLARELEKLGFTRIVKLPDWEPFPLADGFTATIIRDQSLFKMDSALVVEAGGRRFVDRNDCHLSDEHRARLRELGVDLLLSQFSGAMWYPAIYDYSPERRQEIAGELRAGLLTKFVERANSIRPRHVVHAAGPPCFLDDEFLLQNSSRHGIFHDQLEVFDELQARLEARLHLIAPGDRLTFGASGELEVERTRPFDFSAKERIIQRYREERLPLIRKYLASLPRPELGFMEQFKRHLGRLFGSSRLLRSRSNSLTRFEICGEHGGTLYVDTRDDRFAISTGCTEAPSYEFFLDGPIARLLVDGVHHWEEVFLSMRFRARRNPDEYNWPLFALLRYGHDPRLIRRIEETLTRAELAITRVREDATVYTIQRYCPHSGEDLAHAPVRDGLLTCPRHRWCFDLRRDGECVRGGNIPLRVYDIHEDEEQEGEV